MILEIVPIAEEFAKYNTHLDLKEANIEFPKKILRIISYLRLQLQTCSLTNMYLVKTWCTETSIDLKRTN